MKTINLNVTLTFNDDVKVGLVDIQAHVLNALIHAGIEGNLNPSLGQTFVSMIEVETPGTQTTGERLGDSRLAARASK